ncbi:hypothetical protein AALP_AA6G324000 [Arabis alpina]|uniref:ADP-ribosyl cyclase/cyclic ADP-ribose hydrolase n=1 Tax=Arabis alpina TaxID=50452 RepID=A0A087GT51_ARAAL|nr:hypothetical protein AALP_AA6G324000 [Arabis alpina]
MASSSSSSHIMRRYHVFPSFHGPDVRRVFLSHLHNLFARKGITTFKDQEIERGHTIGPELVQAIRESRISVVVLSKNYASSSWCLDELVEILNCKEDLGQIVMTIFYHVDPSDVRKQSGDFGSGFEKTCQGKTEEVKQKWIEALAHVATIAGEHSLNWVDEAAMVEKFATDVSNKLGVTPSRNFDGMVGLEAHLREVKTFLCLESDEVKMIGIWGPAGIGKTTIARALYNLLSSQFRFSCFMRNLKMSVDDYDSKLSLQSQLLSKILKHRDMRVHHLGAIKEWLHDQRVLIILDDVHDLEQLEVLAKEPSWFGTRSRIIVTTKYKKILKAHRINVIYHVDFPSKEEALEILCLSAFKQSSPRDCFGELAKEVVNFCSNLPLGLRVLGSSLRGESEDEWRLQLHGLETNLDRNIEDVLRVGYDKLLAKDQSLFLHIACFFNNSYVDHVTTMLADSNMDVKNGLKTLAVKSLVHISTYGRIRMHNLLQQLGRQVVGKQSAEPGKRQFLVEAKKLCDVLLAHEAVTRSVIGRSYYDSKISEVERMDNLKSSSKNANVSLVEKIEYLLRLWLLDWESCPRKSTFLQKYLVELDMRCRKLWGGIQNKRVEPVMEEKKQQNVSERSTMMTCFKPLPEHKVFINFCGNDLHHGFVRHLVNALERDGVIYTEIDELPHGDLTNKGIKESSIALVIFSSRYAESKWSLNELVKIKELMEGGKLLVIPIFYKVEPLEVTQLKGDFGVKFWNLWRIHRDHHVIIWKEALESVASMKGIYSNEHISEIEFITVTVKNVLERISLSEGESTEMRTGIEEKSETYLNTHHLFGMEKRMEQLEKKLEFDCNETRIVGVVGMPGIGKTTLAMMLHKKWNCKFIRCLPLLGIRKKSKDYGTVWLRKTLLEVLLEGKFPDISEKTTHESLKDKLLQTKVFIVLGDVSDKKQLEFLLGDLDWIKKGSKIVITTCDKSLIEGCAHDLYVVPALNDREAFQLFNYHAFDDQICSPTDTFVALSRMFVDYARGHPMVLNLLGRELRGKDKAHWEHKLAAVTSSN